MCFEVLANELLLDVFECLDAINLLRAFYGLNNRFDQLVMIQTQRYYLNFCSISKHDFEVFCRQYLSSINNRAISLHLSDDVDTPNLPQIFISYGYYINQFIHLKSLTICYSYSFDLLNGITSQCRELLHLTYLNITINSNEDSEEHFRDFINNIWSLSALTHCYLDIIYPYPEWILEMSTISQSIKSLFLKNIFYNSHSLSYLFKHTPNLQRLSVGKIFEFNDLQMEPIFSSLISLSMVVESSAIWMKNLFQRIPNLCYLTLQVNNLYLDGQEWETIFRTYLKQLKIFRFKMTVEFSALDKDFEEQVEQLLDTFRSNFWIDNHQWFVQCDWCPTDINQIALLYTLPYAFDTFYCMDGSQSKSTHPNQWDYSFYNRVHTLHHTDRKKNFNMNLTTSAANRFINLRHLKIKLPFSETFWSAIPTLDRLISLDVTISQESDYPQLQTLIDRASHVYSLRFCLWNNFSIKSFNIHSTSIRRLEFYSNYGSHSKQFNSTECALFTRSSLALQCQILIIDVESRTNILQLIQTMPNLQALRIQSNKSQNNNRKLLEINDDLIKWLQNHLPFENTSLTIRNSFYQSNLQYKRLSHTLPPNPTNSCPYPESNKLCNFEYAVECRTNATYRPNSVEEVQTIVKNAVAKRLRVRAVGHGHSDSAIWCDDEQSVTIFLDGLNKIIYVNLTEKTIQVLDFYSFVLVDSVISIDLVDAKGNLVTLSASDLRLSAARTSTGVLGVIIRVTLPIMPQFKIRMQVLTLPDGIMQQSDFIDLIRNGTYVSFGWYPRAKVIIIEHGQQVSSSIPGDGKAITFNPDPKFIEIFSTINELLIKNPELGPTIETPVAH